MCKTAYTALTQSTARTHPQQWKAGKPGKPGKPEKAGEAGGNAAKKDPMEHQRIQWKHYPLRAAGRFSG